MSHESRLKAWNSGFQQRREPVAQLPVGSRTIPREIYGVKSAKFDPNKPYSLQQSRANALLCLVAANWRRVDIVRKLVAKGANLYREDGTCGMPLRTAAEKGFEQTVPCLREKSANVEGQLKYV
jgi:hypothetical protein